MYFKDGTRMEQRVHMITDLSLPSFLSSELLIALLDKRKERIFMEAILVGISQVSMGVLLS